MFTARTATSYAPELDFRGAVGTGVPSNLENLVPFAGPYVPPLPLSGTTLYFAFALAGLRAAEPGLNVDSYLTPLGRDILNKVEDMCYDDGESLVANVSIGQIVARPLTDPPIASAIHAILEIQTSGYDRPIFIGQGLADTTVPFPLTAKLAAELVAHGTNLTFRPYPHGHDGTMADSLPDSTPFVAQLFAGQ
jgi:hypothetical protein